MKNIITKSFGVVVAGLFLTACTSQRQVEAPLAAPMVKQQKQIVDANAHSHPANKCTNSVTHSHPNGKKAHQHRYSCKGNGKGQAGSHYHPANSMTKSTRHSHPNGNKPHTHHYSK